MGGRGSIRGAVGSRLSATFVIAIAALILPAIGLAAAKPPDLGKAAGYALVANTTITSTGLTVIDGNLALVGPSVTGFGPGIITGKSDIGNAAASKAEADVLAAHDDRPAWRPSRKWPATSAARPCSRVSITSAPRRPSTER